MINDCKGQFWLGGNKFSQREGNEITRQNCWFHKLEG